MASGVDIPSNSKFFNGAPFGSQSHRFDVSGVHPNSKVPGTFTEVSYDRKSLSKLARRIGPGSYEMKSCINQSEDIGKNSGWARALEVSRLAKIPHLLYRETWEREQFAKLSRGPGRYNHKDFIDELSERVPTRRGMLDMRTERFAQDNKKSHHDQTEESLPGPGSYGKDGIPQKILEEKAQESFGKVASFDWGKHLDRSMQTQGSTVAPGTYEYVSTIDATCQKQFGTRGPYDLFTAARSAPVRAGHFAERKPTRHLGPAEFKQKSFIDELSSKENVDKGKFMCAAQYPTVPVERIFYSTLSQLPRKPEAPAPTDYNPQEQSKPTTKVSHPFMQGAQRFTLQAKQNFMGPGGKNSVGAGRYELTRFEKSQARNGNVSVFKSSVSQRPDLDNVRVLSERLRSRVPNKRSVKVKAKEYEDLIRTKKVFNQSHDFNAYH